MGLGLWALDDISAVFGTPRLITDRPCRRDLNGHQSHPDTAVILVLDHIVGEHNDQTLGAVDISAQKLECKPS